MATIYSEGRTLSGDVLTERKETQTKLLHSRKGVVQSGKRSTKL